MTAAACPQHGGTFEVVVVGAGPTGLVSALLLADLGHRVAVVEQWPEPYPLPRAVGIAHESLRVLQDVGAMESMLPGVLFTEEGSRVSDITTADGELLMRRLDAPHSVSGWPARASFYQPDLERLLDTRARAHPKISVLRGWRVIDVESRPEGVVARAASHGRAQETLRVEGQYVLGCDGANSVVRDGWADIEDLDFAHDWLVVDVIAREARDVAPHLGQILGPPRPITMVSGGPGRRRWEFMRLDHESADELNNEETAWRLLAPFDVSPENSLLERHALYTFKGRWVRNWRSGRRVLAGDAAHLMPPFLGEGFNSGIRDARCVTWQIDLVLRGLADITLLDSYSSERVGQVQEIVSQAVELGRVFCVLDPKEAAVRDQRLREARTLQPSAGYELATPRDWRLGAGTWIASDEAAGYPGIQPRVQTAHGPERLDDVLGRGRFMLLGHGIDPANAMTPELRSWWDQLGGITAQLGGEGGFVDADGRSTEWFERHKCAVALFRPDHYVFGTSNSVDGTLSLLLQLHESIPKPVAAGDRSAGA